MIQLLKLATVFLLGGITYYFLEVVFNGGSHVAMILCGGACIAIGDYVSKKSKQSMFKKCIMVTGIILYLEYITGLITNIWLGLEIWDYSQLPLNVMGQVCLYFGILWFVLSPLLIWYGSTIRWHYTRAVMWLEKKVEKEWQIEKEEKPIGLRMHYWLLYKSIWPKARIKI